MYKDKPFHIGTVRFTNKTYTENLEWRTRKNHKGCIYGLDTKITDSVNKGEYIFVMEMKKMFLLQFQMMNMFFHYNVLIIEFLHY